jgi:excisionase family DNA binding protein
MATANRPKPSVQLMDCAGVADTLGCSKRTVRRMTELRTIPFVNIGRLVRFRPHDIDQYIAANMTEAVR